MSALAPIEVATGIVFGAPRRSPRLRSSSTPAEALAAAVRPAVRSGACFVSFSGGRDSSAVLAAATHAARQEGLPDPVPLTIRALDDPRSDETQWQERVIGHLALKDWVRLEIADELDAVGPYARRVLGRHGLLWPFNAHFHLPMLERAEGGTLLTGIGGDELWSASRAPSVRLRRRALAYAPRLVRREVLLRREPIAYPWLRPGAVRAAQRAAGADSASEPRTTAARLAWLRGMRSMATGIAALDRIAGDCGAGIAHPLLDRGLWGAVAHAAPKRGFTRRDDALAAVAGHVLPEAIIERRSKASFNRLFFHDHGRAFARTWEGEGVPDQFVDAEALRSHWLGEHVDPHSLTLLQAAWLASARDRGQEPLERVLGRAPVTRTP